MSDWRLVYGSDTSPDNANEGDLWAVGIQPTTGQPAGKAIRLTHWNDYSPSAVGATLDGKTISTLKMSQQVDVYVGELSNQGTSLETPRRFTLDNRDDWPYAWTPDSRAVLFMSDRSGTINTYRQDLQKQSAERILGAPEMEAAMATLTPDGAWMLYASRPKQKAGTPPGLFRLMRVPVSGGSPELVLDGLRYDNELSDRVFNCPRAGPSCILTERKDKELIFYALDPLKGKGKELARSEINPTFYYGWAISPDGSHIAVVNRIGPYVRTIDLLGGTQRDVPVPADWQLQSVAWSADGKAVFVTVWTERAYLLTRVELTGQTHVLKNGGTGLWMNGIVPSPDGRYLAFAAQTWDSNVWLLEKF